VWLLLCVSLVVVAIMVGYDCASYFSRSNQLYVSYVARRMKHWIIGILLGNGEISNFHLLFLPLLFVYFETLGITTFSVFSGTDDYFFQVFFSVHLLSWITTILVKKD
jgi:hypothetical protein